MTNIPHTRPMAAAAASLFQQEPHFCSLRCVAHAAEPQVVQRLHKLRLAVSVPRACFSCFARKRVVAAFKFNADGAGLKQREDGLFEQASEWTVVDVGRLRRLDEDLPLKVTCKMDGRKTSARGAKSLGEFLHELQLPTREDVTIVGQTLHMVVGPAGAQLGWVLPLDKTHDSRLTFDDPASRGVEEDHHQLDAEQLADTSQGVDNAGSSPETVATPSPATSMSSSTPDAAATPSPATDDLEDLPMAKLVPASEFFNFDFSRARTGDATPSSDEGVSKGLVVVVLVLAAVVLVMPILNPSCTFDPCPLATKAFSNYLLMRPVLADIPLEHHPVLRFLSYFLPFLVSSPDKKH